MLQAVGPQEWFYKELQTVEETSFRWKEQVWNMFILITVCEMFEYFCTVSSKITRLNINK